MFERYNIDELFIARIEFKWSEHPNCSATYGALAKFLSEGYSYCTIVRKVGDRYIDLKEPETFISLTRDYRRKSHTIVYIEPLSNYYTKDGKKIGKRNAIKQLSKNYDTFNHKSLTLTK